MGLSCSFDMLNLTASSLDEGTGGDLHRLALTPCGLANAGLGYDPYTTNYHVTRPNSALQASVRAGVPV